RHGWDNITIYRRQINDVDLLFHWEAAAGQCSNVSPPPGSVGASSAVAGRSCIGKATSKTILNPTKPDSLSQIASWLNTAETHWKQYLFAKENTGSLDRIYVEYMMTYTISVEMIPNHKDYPSFKTGTGAGGRT